jgi:homoserine kinase
VSLDGFVIRAPASTANLGPGFDCAAAALDLWNELHVLPAADGEPLVTLEGVGAGELPTDASHLAVRAFALAAPIAGHRFHFVNRIPLERGLGSSAATVAAGVIAGLVAASRDASLEEVLELGLPLEGHADNLAAALVGGVCLTCDGRIARVADDLPASAIAVIPSTQVRTTEARAALPATLSHKDAAFSAGRAALLGAALASGDAGLLAASADDRLHEPYRAEHAPHLAAIRADLPSGALGATLSGSGPTVLVWAEPERAGDVALVLLDRFPDHEILHLSVATTGAGAA